MSRAVEQEISTLVNTGSPQNVYNDIVKALRSHGPHSLLQIEFLGKSHPLSSDCNILQDGNSIAIPKLKLVQAFVIARQIFFQNLKDFKVDRHPDLRDASSVMLLMDPEHLTAASVRKRLIQTYQNCSTAELDVVISREILFIDSMLTSPLHRHTKSPTLWGHRRWVLELCQSLQRPVDIRRELTTIIFISAEKHPRNYYAWSHMRWLIQTFGDVENTTDKTQNSQELRKKGVVQHRQLVLILRDWCLRHPGDTSGWSFLLFCLLSVKMEDNNPETLTRIEANSSIFADVIGLAVSFNWMHESLWVFLRTLVASGELTEEQRVAFFKMIKVLFEAPSVESKSRSILQAAYDWCVEYEKNIQDRQ